MKFLKGKNYRNRKLKQDSLNSTGFICYFKKRRDGPLAMFPNTYTCCGVQKQFLWNTSHTNFKCWIFIIASVPETLQWCCRTTFGAVWMCCAVRKNRGLRVKDKWIRRMNLLKTQSDKPLKKAYQETIYFESFSRGSFFCFYILKAVANHRFWDFSRIAQSKHLWPK